MRFRHILTAAMLVAVVRSARGSTDPIRQARDLIAVYVQATGGRAALDADTLLHRAGHSVGQGLQGRWQDWRRGPDHLLRVDQTGMLRTKMGYDGSAGWRTDFTSKQVGPVEGKDLEALRAEVWFESEQWARDTTARVRIGAAAFLSGRTLQAVEITPPVGPKKQLWFDKKTGLVARVTH